jgi:hypothetical protein
MQSSLGYGGMDSQLIKWNAPQLIPPYY